MMRKLATALGLMVLALSLMLQPVAAYAQTAKQDDTTTNISYKNGAGSEARCPQFKSVIMTVVYCVQIAVVTGTQLFLSPISDLMFPINLAVITLAVSFFGYRLSTGDSEPKRRTFGLLLKIGVVLLFGYDFGGWMLPTFGASVSLQDAIVTSLWNSPNCPISGFTSGAPSYSYISSGGQNVWATLDCIIGKLFGFGGSFAMAASIFGMLGSLLGSGTIGIMVFFFALTTLISIFFFALRVVYIFLVSFILTGFLITISPMVMPTILFRSTQHMFDAWLKNLMASMLIPGALFAYLCLIMPLLDYAVTGNNPESLQKVVSEKDIMNAYRNEQQRVSMATSETDYSWFRATGIDIQQWVERGPFRNVLVPSRSAATDAGQFTRMTSMDFGANHLQKLWEIGYSLMRVFLIGILVTMMANMIPQLVLGWIGGGWAAGDASGSQLPGEAQLSGAMNSLQGRLTQSARSGRGGPVGGLMTLVGRR
jgi:hypothetical protein